MPLKGPAFVAEAKGNLGPSYVISKVTKGRMGKPEG